MMTSVKSTLPLLVLPFILYIVYAQTNKPCGCELQVNRTYPGFVDIEVYQCHGCCFSREYPTPMDKKMSGGKNFTLEATCCIPENETQIMVPDMPENDFIYNHTGCHCGTCTDIKEF